MDAMTRVESERVRRRAVLQRKKPGRRGDDDAASSSILKRDARVGERKNFSLRFLSSRAHTRNKTLRSAMRMKSPFCA